MPRSVYSIRAEASLTVHLSDIEKLLTLKTITPKIEEAIREHIAVARAAVVMAHEHATAAGHLNDAFQREHEQRLEGLAGMERRVNDFLRENPPR